MSDSDEVPQNLLDRLGRDEGRNLFVPAHFDFSKTSDILEFVAHNPLAQLVSLSDNGLRATAAPLVHDDDADSTRDQRTFIGHIARRNAHVRAVREGREAVALITGPNAYISPRWNVESPSLPTWSFVAVQLRGVFDVASDLNETRDILDRTIAHMERDAPQPWTLDDAPPELADLLIHHIVAFRFRVHDMQGVRRLNQNRKPADREGIVQGLLNEGSDGARQIAELMKIAEETDNS